MLQSNNHPEEYEMTVMSQIQKLLRDENYQTINEEKYENQEKSDKEFFTELGFTLSEFLDVKNFTPLLNIQNVVKKYNSTVCGFHHNQLVQVYNELHFGNLACYYKENRNDNWRRVKKWGESQVSFEEWIQKPDSTYPEIPKFNEEIFKELGFSPSEILDIKTFIDIPDLQSHISLTNKTIVGLTVEEIREALAQYRQRRDKYCEEQFNH